ncbi:TetR/AcrR family transcriptional regulator [Panacagrimonas sp.]|uniref:TetR/AcrR family transcriptional regulator n=1 Tax=Panacagrimonas sp. TaxID=2480088 RepID=UPI003B517128
MVSTRRGPQPAAKAPRQRASRMTSDKRTREILAVARDVFVTHGFHATAVTEIASRLGVAEGTVFKYFPTKRELLNRVIEHWYGELFGDYTKDLSMIRGARNRFRYLVWRHLKTIREWPGMCRLIFSDVRSQPGYSRSPLHRMNLKYTGLFLDVVREGIGSGEFRDDVPLELLRDLVYGGIEHHAWGFLYRNTTLDAERSADQITDLVCTGIELRRPLEPSLTDADLCALADRLERVAATLRKA